MGSDEQTCLLTNNEQISNGPVEFVVTELNCILTHTRSLQHETKIITIVSNDRISAKSEKFPIK